MVVSVIHRMQQERAVGKIELEPEIALRETISSKIYRTAMTIFSIICFPVFLYQGVHALLGMFSQEASFKIDEKHAEQVRLSALTDTNYVYKRLTFEVEGYTIDATMFCKPAVLNTGKWISHAIGSDATYENELLANSQTKQLMEATNAGAIVFNYPGVGKSEGWPSRAIMVAAQRAIFDYLQNEVKAKEIIALGSSIGGGVQALALDGYHFNDGVSVKSVKFQTFTRLTDKAAQVAGCISRWVAWFFGWEMDVVAASKRLTIPEIIVQSGSQDAMTPLTHPNQVLHDGAFAPSSSLAYELLNNLASNKQCVSYPKHHMSIMEPHEANHLARLLN